MLSANLTIRSKLPRLQYPEAGSCDRLGMIIHGHLQQQRSHAIVWWRPLVSKGDYRRKW